MTREMKDSTIEWVGKIPREWKTVRVSNLFQERKSPNRLGQESNRLSLSYGNIIRKDINSGEGLLPESFNTYNIIEPNDIIIRPTDLQNDKTSLRTGLSTEHGIITSAYIALRPNSEDIDSRYFHYLLHSYDLAKVFYNMGNGVRQGLTFNLFARLLVLEPPLSEQQSIANYLDHKTSQIDALVTNIEAQIVKLDEYKKALISQAVTKGLDPNVEMKDSSVEWIGEIPKEWNLAPAKYLIEIKKRIAGKEGLTVLSITQSGIKPKDITSGEGQLAESYVNYQLIHPGEFGMNHMDLLTGWIDLSNYFGVVSPDYRVFTVKHPQIDKRYLLYLFQMCYKNKIFYGLGQGAALMGRWRLPATNMMNMKLPVPPLDEQRKIALFLDNTLATVDKKRQNLQSQITTLSTYKKSLIFDYVTGKKEVPSSWKKESDDEQ